MKVIVLRQKAQDFEVMEIEDDLAVLKSIIGCDAIDIAYRKIGDKYYEIVCDDEGLINDSAFTALDISNRSVLAGNLIITGEADNEGNLTSLTDEDVERISKHMVSILVEDSSIMILSMSY